mgnify:CR=1 FL=1
MYSRTVRLAEKRGVNRAMLSRIRATQARSSESDIVAGSKAISAARESSQEGRQHAGEAVEGLGDLGRAIVEFAYGDVYTRPGLTLRDREIAAVAALVATGRSSQIPQHLRASLKAGLTPDELREIILQTATIAGFPPAMNAMATLKTVLGPES